MWSAGEVLDERYEVIGELGRGGQGLVLLVHDRLRDQRIAMKILLTPREDPNQLRRLRREVQLMSRLRHASVVPVHDIVPLPHHLALTMPYIQGASLADKVDAQGPLSSEQVAHLARTLTEVLTDAHRQGVVHGDLTPRNVLLQPDGTPRLTDFGMARQLHDDPTRVGGTLGFLAPEVLEGSLPHMASDTYALGAVLWFASTGQTVPVRLWGQDDRLRQHLSKHTPLPGALVDWMLAALSPDPERRPSLTGNWRTPQAAQPRPVSPAPSRAHTPDTPALVGWWVLIRTDDPKLGFLPQLERPERFHPFRLARHKALRSRNPRLSRWLRGPIGRQLRLSGAHPSRTGVDDHDGLLVLAAGLSKARARHLAEAVAAKGVIAACVPGRTLALHLTPDAESGPRNHQVVTWIPRRIADAPELADLPVSRPHAAFLPVVGALFASTFAVASAAVFTYALSTPFPTFAMVGILAMAWTGAVRGHRSIGAVARWALAATVLTAAGPSLNSFWGGAIHPTLIGWLLGLGVLSMWLLRPRQLPRSLALTDLLATHSAHTALPILFHGPHRHPLQSLQLPAPAPQTVPHSDAPADTPAETPLAAATRRAARSLQRAHEALAGNDAIPSLARDDLQSQLDRLRGHLRRVSDALQAHPDNLEEQLRTLRAQVRQLQQRQLSLQHLPTEHASRIEVASQLLEAQARHSTLEDCWSASQRQLGRLLAIQTAAEEICDKLRHRKALTSSLPDLLRRLEHDAQAALQAQHQTLQKNS